MLISKIEGSYNLDDNPWIRSLKEKLKILIKIFYDYDEVQVTEVDRYFENESSQCVSCEIFILTEIALKIGAEILSYNIQF